MQFGKPVFISYDVNREVRQIRKELQFGKLVFISDDVNKEVRQIRKELQFGKPLFIVPWWRSGFDLSLVIRDPEI